VSAVLIMISVVILIHSQYYVRDLKIEPPSLPVDPSLSLGLGLNFVANLASAECDEGSSRGLEEEGLAGSRNRWRLAEGPWRLSWPVVQGVEQHHIEEVRRRDSMCSDSQTGPGDPTTAWSRHRHTFNNSASISSFADRLLDFFIWCPCTGGY
jgi:hypothetical protein